MIENIGKPDRPKVCRWANNKWGAIVAENGYKYTFLEYNDAGIATSSVQVAEGFVGYVLDKMQCGIIGVSMFVGWYELQQECYTAIEDENLDSWKETDPFAKFNQSFCGKEYNRIKASLDSVLPYLDKVEQQRMVEICQKFMEWAEVKCGLADVPAQDKNRQRIREALQSAKIWTVTAEEYFVKALADELLEVSENGLKWLGTQKSLACFCGFVFLYRPWKKICKVFIGSKSEVLKAEYYRADGYDAKLDELGYMYR